MYHFHRELREEEKQSNHFFFFFAFLNHILGLYSHYNVINK